MQRRVTTHLQMLLGSVASIVITQVTLMATTKVIPLTLDQYTSFEIDECQ